MDEATSQIDPESAKAIRCALREVRKGRTVIVIAHGSDAHCDADRIVELHEGRVVRITGGPERAQAEPASSLSSTPTHGPASVP
jgi:ATP-binding cassette subfamily B protein